jgi:hypothetical protein
MAHPESPLRPAALVTSAKVPSPYASYVSYTIDGNRNITQTVIVDGTTTGDCWLNGGYWIPNCPAQHYIDGYNSVNGVGGYFAGPGGDMFSYLSYESDVIAPLPPEIDVFSGTEARIWCDVGAAYIYEGGFFSTLISIRDTYYGPPPTVTPAGCVYTMLACSTGTPTCKGASVGVMFTSGCPNYLHSEYLVVGGVCLISFDGAATGPGPCN